MIDIKNNVQSRVNSFCYNYGKGDGCNVKAFSHITSFGENNLPGSGSGEGYGAGYGMGYGVGNIVGNGYGIPINETDME